MTNTSKTVTFFGSGPVAAASLRSIAEHFSVEVVITKAVPTHHKGVAPVEELARELHLPILFASNKNELDQLIDQEEIKSPIGIVVDYGVIISQKVIDHFPYGIVNSHFSLLPQWRGADPITFSILSGDLRTGVSLMVIDAGLDTGKLITQKVLYMSEDETTPTLTDKLVNLSNQLLAEFLPRYVNDDIQPKAQPHPDRVTYSRKLTKEDSILDWSKPAAQLEREVRAFRGWPKSRATVLNQAVIVTKSHVSKNANTALDIKCGDGQYLSIDELVGPSGRTMDARAFLNGYSA
ncbi:MAG: fmt [Candidatus Saccharibacteria bacterium]|nr:fmt [Candidatus Saccharibacteria bacterium]